MANSFDIKSAQLSLVSLVLKSDNLQQVSAELLQQFGPDGDSADFFDQDGLVIDFSKSTSPLDADALQTLLKALKSCRLQPVAFRCSRPEDATVARAAGLVEAPLEPAANRAKPVPEQPPAVVREVVKEVVRQLPAASTMVVDRPLRSGQKIYARGADLVVLAMVNQGAEVIADGNIHVYAPLRGKAMAGASGNADARIFSLCLDPELISIAGIYRTSEKPLDDAVRAKPAQVRLSREGGREQLLIEALNP